MVISVKERGACTKIIDSDSGVGCSSSPVAAAAASVILKLEGSGDPLPSKTTLEDVLRLMGLDMPPARNRRQLPAEDKHRLLVVCSGSSSGSGSGSGPLARHQRLPPPYSSSLLAPNKRASTAHRRGEPQLQAPSPATPAPPHLRPLPSMGDDDSSATLSEATATGGGTATVARGGGGGGGGSHSMLLHHQQQQQQLAEDAGGYGDIIVSTQGAGDHGLPPTTFQKHIRGELKPIVAPPSADNNAVKRGCCSPTPQQQQQLYYGQQPPNPGSNSVLDGVKQSQPAPVPQQTQSQQSITSTASSSSSSSPSPTPSHSSSSSLSTTASSITANGSSSAVTASSAQPPPPKEGYVSRGMGGAGRGNCNAAASSQHYPPNHHHHHQQQAGRRMHLPPQPQLQHYNHNHHNHNGNSYHNALNGSGAGGGGNKRRYHNGGGRHGGPHHSSRSRSRVSSGLVVHMPHLPVGHHHPAMAAASVTNPFIATMLYTGTPPDRFLSKAHLIQVTKTPHHLTNGSRWDELSKAVWNKFLTNQQTEETYRKKLTLWKCLYLYIKMMFPRYGLFLVGSTMSGFGSNTSDVDMCLLVRKQEMDQRGEALLHLTNVLTHLNNLDCVDNLELIQAKVPILKFRERNQGLDVDLNCNNAVGIRNTHLLFCYAKMDWRVRPLVLVVKLWAQWHDINDAKNMTISSYSLALMVIHFLQCGCRPPVLPCLHKMYAAKFSPFSDVANIDVHEDLPRYQSDNLQPLGELLVQFFTYYDMFDFSRYAVSVRSANVLTIDECRHARSMKNEPYQWKYLCIEEPFDLTNTARSVYDLESFERIRKVIHSTCLSLSATHALDSIFRLGGGLGAAAGGGGGGGGGEATAGGLPCSWAAPTSNFHQHHHHHQHQHQHQLPSPAGPAPPTSHL